MTSIQANSLPAANHDVVGLRLPTIRRAIPEDAEAIARVHVNAWCWTYEGLLDSAYLWQLSAPKRQEIWREMLDGQAVTSKFAFVAEDKGQIVGFVAAGPDRSDLAAGEIYAIYINQDQLHRGVGRRLHDHALAELREQGHRKAKLWVLDANKRARAFYERQGWVATGEDKLEELDGSSRRELRYTMGL